MLRIILPFLLLLNFSLLGQSSKTHSVKLKEYNKQLKGFNQHLSTVSSEIFQETDLIKSISKELKKINRELLKTKKRYSAEKKKAKILKKESGNISDKQKHIRDKVLVTSTKLISLSVITNEKSEDNLDSIILDEIFEVLSKANVKKLYKFNKGLSDKESKLKTIQIKMDKLKKSIENFEIKKKKFEKKKAQRKELLSKLEIKKTKYKIYLKEAVSKQKLIKRKIEKAQAQMELDRKNAQKRATNKSNITTHIGSSYTKEAVRRYRGKKTISPIQDYTVLTRFGTYIDPIYKFKIFSSSVILQPNKQNSNVRSIFNGRVTLFKDDKTLGKFVMVEHFNGLQTMYAHLDSFAPSIKTGKKIKKGTIIGRVSNKLYFEVMEKNYRIDPLQVIK